MKRIVACLFATLLAFAVTGSPMSGTACAFQADFASGSNQFDAPRLVQGRDITLVVRKHKRLKLVEPKRAVTWKSSNEQVATVTQHGIVKARRPGITIVSACDASTGLAASCVVKTYRVYTGKQVQRRVLALKKTYWPGRSWTNENYYFWQARLCHCYGCAAFAGIASDSVFGKFAPLTRHATFPKIKVGDHIRIANKHSVVVLRAKKRSVVVVEGNYHGAIQWGRSISRDLLERKGFYVETRHQPP